MFIFCLAPEKMKGIFQSMKLWKCFFFHEETSPKNVRASQAKRSPTRWWQWYWKRDPFPFCWGLIGNFFFFFFSGLELLKTLGEQSWFQSCFVLKNYSPWNLGKWSNERLAHPFFFSNGWLKPPGHQLTSWILMVETGFPEGRRAAHAFREQQRGDIVWLPGKSPKKTDGGCWTSPFDRKNTLKMFFSNDEWTANVRHAYFLWLHVVSGQIPLGCLGWNLSNLKIEELDVFPQKCGNSCTPRNFWQKDSQNDVGLGGIWCICIWRLCYH